MSAVRVRAVTGNLLDQPVEALVNPWNRNFVPRGLLLTGGISGQLKAVTGPGPWRDLARMGVLSVGDAVMTSAGDMAGPKYLIHVVGLNTFWRATAASVEACARSAAERARPRQCSWRPGGVGMVGHPELYADSEHPRPEVVGPYPSQEQAEAAMEDSLLIDGFVEDTNRDEWLDDVYVAPDPASISRMCADCGHRVTLIDPGDPSHFGDPAPEAAVTARSGWLQAAALHAPSLDEGGPAAEGISAGTDRSPAGPTM